MEPATKTIARIPFMDKPSGRTASFSGGFRHLSIMYRSGDVNRLEPQHRFSQLVYVPKYIQKRGLSFRLHRLFAVASRAARSNLTELPERVRLLVQSHPRRRLEGLMKLK